jgi:hypothetical protein
MQASQSRTRARAQRAGAILDRVQLSPELQSSRKKIEQSAEVDGLGFSPWVKVSDNSSGLDEQSTN